MTPLEIYEETQAELRAFPHMANAPGNPGDPSTGAEAWLVFPPSPSAPNSIEFWTCMTGRRTRAEEASDIDTLIVPYHPVSKLSKT